MKKNYIKPATKTVLSEMAVATMQVVASYRKIEYGGVDQGENDAEAEERPAPDDDFNEVQHSLW